MSDTFSRVINIYVESGQAQQAYDVLVKKQQAQIESLNNAKKKQQEYLDAYEKGSKESQQKVDELTNKIDKQKVKLSELERQEKEAAAAFVSGGEAEKKTFDDISAKIEKEIAALNRLEQRKLRQEELAKKGNPAAKALYDSQTASVEKLEKELQKTTSALDKQAQKVTGTLTPSLRDLQNTASTLKKQLATMSPEETGFDQLKTQWQDADTAVKKYSLSLTSVKQGLQDLLKEAKGIAAGVIIGNTVQAAVQSIGSEISGFVNGAAKVSDEISDIEKVTSLSKQHVRELNSELSKIDTRTTNSNLRGLAVEAGKLGKDSVEDIRNFVEEANQIKTALGDDLGEDAVTQIGKVADIFDTSMLKIGSGINAMSDSTSAAGGFLQDFLFRLAGTGKQLNITAGDLLGFGTILDMNGAQVEASSTAIQKFLLDFVKNSAPFEKAAGMVKGSLAEMISEKGVNAAFIEFIKNMKAANPSDNGFLSAMEKVGINGERGASTFLILANNIDQVAEKQAFANNAIAEGTSITNEYEKRNNNLAATIQKIGKAWSSITASSTVQDFLNAGATGTLNFLKAIKLLPDWIKQNSIAIIALATAYTVYNAQQILSTLNTQKNTAARLLNNASWAIFNNYLRVGAAFQAAYAAGTAVLTGEITLADLATKAWGATTAVATGGITILIGAIVAAGTALAIWVNKQKEAITYQNTIASIQKQASESIASEKAELESLVAIARDENIVKEKRIEAIEKLKKISPEYLGFLSLETINTDAATTAIKAYLTQLQKRAEQEALYSRLKAGYEKETDIGSMSVDDLLSTWEKINYSVDEATKKAYVNKKREEETNKVLKERDYILKALAASNAPALKPLTAAEDKAAALNSKPLVFISSVNKSSDTQIKIDPTQGGDEAAKKKHDDALAQYKKFQQQLEDISASTAAALKSQDDKEIEAVNQKYEALLREAKEYHAKLTSSNAQYANDEKRIETAKQNELAVLRAKQTKEQIAKDYQENLVAAQDNANEQKRILQNQLTAGEISQGEYDSKVQSLDMALLNERIAIAKEYQDYIEKAATDRVTFEKNANDAVARNEAEAAANRIKQAKVNAQLQREADSYLSQNSNSPKVRYKAAKDANKEEYDIKVAQANGDDKTIKKLGEVKDTKDAKAKNDYITESASQYLGYASQIVNVFSSINDFISSQENSRLVKEKKAHDKSVALYDKQLAQKLISQKQHDDLVAAADAKLTAQQNKVAEQQFKRNKALQIAQATIAGATQAIQNVNIAQQAASIAGPAAPAVFAGVLAALEAVTATMLAFQIGTIASAEYSPQYGDGTASLGGVAHSHPSGGNPILDPTTGKVIGKIEKKEAIIPEDAAQLNPDVIQYLLTTGRKQKLFANIAPVRQLNVSQNLENIAYANGGMFGASLRAQSTSRSFASNDSVNRLASDPQMERQNKLLEAILEQSQITAKKELNYDVTKAGKATQQLINIYSRTI